jgi:hypothetical protein
MDSHQKSELMSSVDYFLTEIREMGFEQPHVLKAYRKKLVRVCEAMTTKRAVRLFTNAAVLLPAAASPDEKAKHVEWGRDQAVSSAATFSRRPQSNHLHNDPLVHCKRRHRLLPAQLVALAARTVDVLSSFETARAQTFDSERAQLEQCANRTHICHKSRLIAGMNEVVARQIDNVSRRIRRDRPTCLHVTLCLRRCHRASRELVDDAIERRCPEAEV